MRGTNNLKKPAEGSIVKSNSDGKVLFATSTKKGSASDWVLDSGCTCHMCPQKDWFSTYDPVDSSVVHRVITVSYTHLTLPTNREV